MADIDYEGTEEGRRKIRLLRETKYDKKLYDLTGKLRADKQIRDSEKIREGEKRLKQKARSRQRTSCEEAGAPRFSIGCGGKSGA